MLAWRRRGSELLKEGGLVTWHGTLTEDGHPRRQEVLVDEGADLALVEAAQLRGRPQDLDGAVPLVLAVIRHVAQVDPVLEKAPHRLRPENVVWRCGRSQNELKKSCCLHHNS